MENRYKYIDENRDHMHTLDGKPLMGTSTVLKVLAKPLTWWASGLACEKFGWTKIQDKLYNIPQEIQDEVRVKGLEFKRGSTAGTVVIPKEVRIPLAMKVWNKIVGMSGADYLKLLDEAYKAHSVKLKDTAQDGTDLHAEIERFVKNTMENKMDVYNEKIQPFIDWANVKIKRFLWLELNCYSEKHWLGGISDIGYETTSGVYGILDIKSSKDAYLNQFFQIAGYDIQISENGGYDKNGNKTFTLDKPITEYVVFPFGMQNPAPQFYYDIAGAKECFLAALTLYKKMEL